MEIVELKKLYMNKSKHSNYQILSGKLSKIVDNKVIKIKGRFEKERLDYILKNVDIKNKKILDIGGNTGYFTFELIDKKAKSIDYYEGNRIHAKFVKEAAEILKVRDKVNINEEYYMFNKKIDNKYDVVILLNVLHHIGDDYGNKELLIQTAKDEIIKQINKMSYSTDIIVLQIGFNWKGNSKLSLFKNGTKKEMINFIKEGTKEYWKIINIGIPEQKNNEIKYYDLNEINLKRYDKMGEFLNRPIFIMKSLHMKNKSTKN